MTKDEMIKIGIELDSFNAWQLKMLKTNSNYFNAQQIYNIIMNRPINQILIREVMEN